MNEIKEIKGQIERSVGRVRGGGEDYLLWYPGRPPMRSAYPTLHDQLYRLYTIEFSFVRPAQ